MPHRRPHRRHRDLPAKVRRRQAAAVTVVVIAAGAVIYFSLVRGEEAPEEVPIGRLVGQTVIGKLSRSGVDEAILKRVRKGQLGGVIVFPRNEESLRADASRLQKAAAAGGNPPLLIAIDQEGGPVKRLRQGPPDTSPRQLGKQGDASASRSEGEATGAFLADLGVNVDLAPVFDVAHPATPETIADRTFSSDPAEVADLATAFAEGLAAGGVAATAKHFPGLGLAPANTDVKQATINAQREDLKPEIEPFRAGIDAGVPLVMMATAVYPAFGSTDPAAWSEPIVQGELRDGLGFDGVVITDDLESPAVTGEEPAPRAARKAIRAGVDLVLTAQTVRASYRVYRSLVKDARKGKLDRATLESVYDRILALKDSLAGG